MFDETATAVIRAVEKHNCRALFDANAERVAHFKRRISDRGDDPADVVIVVLAVDDCHGRGLAETLMPGHDWKAYRDRGEVPVARGLAGREGITEAIDEFDADAANKLRAMAGVAVVVVDRGVAEIFAA